MTELRLELAAAVFWTFNAFLYLIADVGRLQEMWRQDEMKQIDKDKTEDLSETEWSRIEI